MAVLLASFGVQACMAALHQLPPVQSASTLQPPAGWQSRLLLHEPVRQTVAAFAEVQGPLFTAYPHLSSLPSHTEEMQTSVAAGALQVPAKGGLTCAGSFGMLLPFVSLTLHVWLVALHHWPPVQSLSTLHPPAGWHKRLALQEPERQTVPALAAVHGP